MVDICSSKRNRTLIQVFYVAKIIQDAVHGFIPLSCHFPHSLCHRRQWVTQPEALTLNLGSLELAYMPGSKRRRKVQQQHSNSVILFDSNAWYDGAATNRTDYGGSTLSYSLKITKTNGDNNLDNFFVSSFTSAANGASISSMSVSNVGTTGTWANDPSEQPLLSNGITSEETGDIRKSPSPTAPEVNKWTNIMARETTRAFDRSSSKNAVLSEVESLYEGLQSLTEEDHQNIESYWSELLPKIFYFEKQDDVALVKEALRVAYYAHREQRRKSGEPFIIHPVQVAVLLADLKMDVETVISGLLHDTVEDTELTFGQVETLFGRTVRGIVEGETKVSKLPKLAFSDYADEQAENLRQMFVAMTDDYRIIIVKLADRLHNMRTLQFMKPEKQKKISRETLDIFAPLAHRMGIWQFKSELEDTSFMYLYPKEYERLDLRLRRHQAQFRDTLEKSQHILCRTLEADPTLKEQSVEVKVYGRTKELYSLWHKMETKDINDLEQISDVVALRVVLYPKDSENTPNDGNDRAVWLCYHVLGLVQHLPGFQPVPTRVKDYISFPKPNGYQSLHTALMLNGQTVEVQIRTAAMHHVAEYGMASHWAYTGEKRGMDELFNTPWLSTIKEWQNDVLCSRDFVECVRRELLGKRVFVFLRNGKILNLPRGATVIDAAFQIHSEVGLSMHGAHINGRPAPFSYELRNGDVVSILTGGGKPTTDWMRCAKSRSTRARLRAYFRAKQRESLQEAGAILLADFLKVHQDLIAELSFLDALPPKTLEEFAELLPGSSGYEDLDELLMEIGKRHDRRFLRSTVAKVVKVPLWALDEAERRSGNKRRLMSEQVFAAVRKSRRVAQDAGSAAAEDEQSISDGVSSQASGVPMTNGTASLRQSASASAPPMAASLFLEGDTQFADPEQICEDCLPIKGDDIIGTKIVDSKNTLGDQPVTVHRRACIHSQRALNRSLMGSKIIIEPPRSGQSSLSGESKQRYGGPSNKIRFSRPPSREAIPVKLKWSDLKVDEDVTYMAEIVVVANDRKMLLADCSEIVSEKAFIVKTGSATTNEHATLEFLVKVTDLDHLQHLMDSLREVPSVMSVERKFGSDLLR